MVEANSLRGAIAEGVGACPFCRADPYYGALRASSGSGSHGPEPNF
jgi:hypothetical protein